MGWIEILLYILLLVVRGYTRTEAAHSAAAHFNVDLAELMKRLRK
ncbi:MAG: hypothetical protein FD169_1837 [Bacillota bacterium]|nr:MAG: hypothetical protein FD169_1837 [Bacillota bacterium]